MNHYDKLLDNFKAISRIPRPSGRMEEISKFIYDFAVERGYQARRDGAYNVVVFVPATEGYENHDAVMLQGHMDLVAEKAADSAHDFSKDPIELIFEGDIIHANGTTLGGDDGIAVATMMTLMEENDIRHPALEFVFTADEETGMFGAQDLDVTGLKATRMINLDNECEGEFTVSCAGGARFQAALKKKTETFIGKKYLVSVATEKGGHSGVEIHKKRPNAIICLFRALKLIQELADGAMRIISVKGGKMDNAIPMNAEAEIVLGTDVELSCIEAQIAAPFNSCDDHPHFRYEAVSEGVFSALSDETNQNLISAVLNVPDGVVAFSQDIEGLVESSMNLGVIKEKDDCILVRISTRSSKEDVKKQMISDLTDLFRKYGFSEIEVSGDYPGWAYRKESSLRDTMTEIYSEKYTPVSGRKVNVIAIHAGLECGLILQKMPSLDIVSIGADANLIHTPKEYVLISSMNRMYDYILDVLEAL